MKLVKNEWYEIHDRIVRVAEAITIDLSPNIQEIRVYDTYVHSDTIGKASITTDVCIMAVHGNTDIKHIVFWDLGSKLSWSVFRDLIVRYYSLEDLLLEAKRRFPTNTKYYPAHLYNANVELDANFIVGLDQNFIVEAHSYDVELQNPDKGVFSKDRNGHAYNQVLFHQGKWAKILSKPSNNQSMTRQERLLAEAISKYPIGTQYIPLKDSGRSYSIDDIAKVVRTPNGNSDCIEGGPGYLYARGSWAEIVKVKIDTNALLAKARKEYPEGTRYRPISSSGRLYDTTVTVTREPNWHDSEGIEGGPGYIYYQGKWAEIAKDNIDYDAILEIAKRKYPKGTKYMPLSSEGNLYTSAKISNREAHWYNKKSEDGDKDRIEIGYGFAYIDGKWAEVVEEAISNKPTVKSIPTEEEVLRRYPKGTWYIPIAQGGGVLKNPKQSEGNYGDSEDYIWVSNEMGTGYVYDIENQKWADIVPNPNSVEVSMPEYPVTTQEAYFPTEKLVARKEVLTKQSASQHKVEELPLLKIKKF